MGVKRSGGGLGEGRLGEEPDRTFLDLVRAAAARCGVTRLADITGLDRLGLPVWQAVRPAALALSVHQGKGRDDVSARIGALCEAIESHCAEHAVADGPLCRWSALPAAERVSDPSDFARLREPALPDRPVQWSLARNLLTGRAAWLLHAVVSLDFTRGLPSLFDRSSNGMGAGPTEHHALATGLLECLERDAVGEWQRRPEAEQAADRVDLGTIGYPWFGDWCERLRARAIALEISRFETVTGFPVCVCVIGAAAEFGEGYRRFYGSSAHPDPEVALFKSLAEAIQSRLTLIAGVRDDIYPSYYRRHLLAGPPAPADPPTGRWREVEPVADPVAVAIDRLAASGYELVLAKRLDRDFDGVVVTKVFVPGLGTHHRTRRIPA